MHDLGIVDIDHVVVRVESLDAARLSYERLGFTVTPLREHLSQAAWVAAAASGGAASGNATINQRHVLFNPYPGQHDVGNFISFIAVEDQLATPPAVTQMASYLADTEGPRTIVLQTKDVEAARAAMAESGIESFPPINFETGWFDAEREVFVPITSKASVPIMGQVPFMFDPYETSTLASYHYAPWTQHENGARYISAVNGVTRDVRRDAELMASKVFGVSVDYHSEDVAIVRRRDISLRIMSPVGFATLYPGLDFSGERVLPHTFGLTIAVDALDDTGAVLRRNGVRHYATHDGIAVARDWAHNTLLEFVPTAGT